MMGQTRIIFLVALLGTSFVVLAMSMAGFSHAQTTDAVVEGASQDRKLIVGMGSPPTWEGTADGDLSPLLLDGGDLKASVLSHPLPKVFLSFKASEMQRGTSAAVSIQTDAVMRVDLSSTINVTLASLWHAELEYSYKKEIEGISSGQAQVNEQREVLRSIIATIEFLKRQTIDAPNGRRNISENEALDILRFMRASVESVTEQAQKFKG